MVAALCASALGGPACGAADAGASSAPAWRFTVLLDGRAIGRHTFRIDPAATDAERTLVSEADYAVTFVGITVYRYQHRAVERWRGDCLAALNAETNDNGTRSTVAAEQRGEAFEVKTPMPQQVRGCVMTFAYWNPALRAQKRLLNAQTGRIEAVEISDLGEAVMPGGGAPITAHAYRINGLPTPIDIWYSAQGEWLGLDTVVNGGRKLSYRRA
jgi:hypothetical protein